MFDNYSNTSSLSQDLLKQTVASIGHCEMVRPGTVELGSPEITSTLLFIGQAQVQACGSQYWPEQQHQADLTVAK
jgi:hypothetical protein